MRGAWMWFWGGLSLAWFLGTTLGAECPYQDYESACAIGGNASVTTSTNTTINTTNCDIYVYKSEFTILPPNISFFEAEPTATYTIVFVDRDYYSSNFFTRGLYYLQWISANIPGTQLIEGAVQGTTISAYWGPNPAPNTGVHRLMFIIYKHVYPTTRVSSPVPDTQRTRFRLANWLYQYREVLICQPVAGIQFRTHA